MRIAIFSDVHANLPALEACFQSIESQKPDMAFCLGDLVGYNIWPNEVINEIRKRNIATIAGNYDYGVGRKSDDCGCAYTTEPEKRTGAQSIAFTNSIIGEEERAYLRTLPAHLTLEFQLNGEKMNLLLVHGSPRKINEYLYEDRDEKSFLRIMKDSGAHILCFGHTHKPFHRILKTEEGDHLHAINTGSVGRPKDHDPRGGYVLLDISESSNIRDPDSVKVTFIRFDYDVEGAAKAVEDSPLPNEFAAILRNGY